MGLAVRQATSLCKSRLFRRVTRLGGLLQPVTISFFSSVTVATRCLLYRYSYIVTQLHYIYSWRCWVYTIRRAVYSRGTVYYFLPGIYIGVSSVFA